MSDNDATTTQVARRRYLLAGATGLSAVLAGCSGGGDGGDGGDGDGGDGGDARPTVTVGDDARGQVDDWLSDASNYDGAIRDYTDGTTPTVTVGAQGNGGNLAFGPPAVAVSPGSTVRWRWNGRGGRHNVVAEDDAYASETVIEGGHTFEHTFESTGASLYVCTPHESFGMKGAVVVQE